MNRSLAVVLLLATLVVGCNRHQPIDDVIVTAPTLTTLQPLSVIDLSAELLETSGIFYNAKNNSLMIIGDGRPEIFEFSLDGKVLKKTMTTGADFEGITMTAGCDTIYCVQETRQLVTSYRLDGTEIASYPVNVATNPKNALEGLAMDKTGNLIVLNEKTPCLMMEFRNGTEVSRHVLTASTDLSDICYDKTGDCFWIVSDESKKVFKVNRSGVVLGEWLVPFEKGEGITFVNDKMYIVSDADSKMYIFQKP